MCECCGVAGVASTEGRFSIAPREGLGLGLLYVIVLFKKRLSNLSVVAGSNAGQSTELLMCSYWWCNLVGKNCSSEENPCHLLVGTGHVVDSNLAQQGWRDWIKTMAISLFLLSTLPSPSVVQLQGCSFISVLGSNSHSVVSFVLTNCRGGLRNIFFLQSQCKSEGTRSLFYGLLLSLAININGKNLK